MKSVDDAAGAAERRLAAVLGHREGQAPADAGAEGAQGHEVGGLARLGALRARHADDPVLAEPPGEQGGVVVAVGRRAVLRGRGDVQVGDGRRGQRG